MKNLFLWEKGYTKLLGLEVTESGTRLGLPICLQHLLDYTKWLSSASTSFQYFRNLVDDIESNPEAKAVYDFMYNSTMILKGF